jgi:hypothetical protein
MILNNNEVKAKKMNQVVKELNQENKKLESFISFRCSNEQLETIKKLSRSEHRTISSYVKSKLF